MNSKEEFTYLQMIGFVTFIVSLILLLTDILSVSRWLNLFKTPIYKKKLKEIKRLNKSHDVAQKYRSLVYMQRAACHEMLFKIWKKKTDATHRLFIYRNIEEFNYVNSDIEKKEFFNEYKELDFLAYNDFIADSYHVVTYKDLDIWIVYKDLDYYIQLLKLHYRLNKKNKNNSGINRMFVIEDINNIELDNDIWAMFIKLLESLLTKIVNEGSIDDSYFEYYEKTVDNFKADVQEVKEKIYEDNKLKILFTLFSIKLHELIDINYTIRRQLPSVFQENGIDGRIIGFGMFDKIMMVSVYEQNGILKYITEFAETVPLNNKRDRIINSFKVCHEISPILNNLLPSSQKLLDSFNEICLSYKDYISKKIN